MTSLAAVSPASNKSGSFERLVFSSRSSSERRFSIACF